MAGPSAGEMNRRLGAFFDAHWILEWFVAPIWLVATILVVLFVFVSTASTVETVQVVGLFVGFSFGIVGLGLSVEYCLYQVFGLEVFHRRTDHE